VVIRLEDVPWAQAALSLVCTTTIHSIVIEPSDARIHRADDMLNFAPCTPVLIVPRHRVIEEMREHMLPGLRFDPEPVLPFVTEAIRR